MASIGRRNRIAGEATSPGEFTLFGGSLYFSAGTNGDGATGRELWRLDGNSTVALVTDIDLGTASSFPAEFTEASGSLYFRADDGMNGREL